MRAGRRRRSRAYDARVPSLGLPRDVAGPFAAPVLRRLPRRVVVRGGSMVPTLHDGDVVLALPGARVRPGQVCLVRWAARPAQLSVKRLGPRAGNGLWDARGDDPTGSTDARTLGPAEALAPVVWRLWPHPGPVRTTPGR